MQLDMTQVPGYAALVALGLHVVVYANKEGKKEQRLTTVEERTKNIPAIEIALAKVSADMTSLDKKVDSLKADLKTDIAEINHMIRNHLMKARS